MIWFGVRIAFVTAAPMCLFKQKYSLALLCVYMFVFTILESKRAYLLVKRRPQSLPILQNGNFSHMRYPNNVNVLCSSLVFVRCQKLLFY